MGHINYETMVPERTIAKLIHMYLLDTDSTYRNGYSDKIEVGMTMEFIDKDIDKGLDFFRVTVKTP